MRVARSRGDRLLLLVLLLVPVVVAVSATWIFDHGSAQTSVFRLSNLVGPTAESLMTGGGLTTCTEAMGTPGNPICFHAGRMPMASVVVAMAVRLVGDHYLRVAMVKVLLLLLPLEMAIYLLWTRLTDEVRWQRGLTVLLLMVPFAMMPFLADVVNLQVEEGYSYSLLALAVAILFFGLRAQGWPEGRSKGQHREIWLAGIFGLAAAGLYLAKSSMAIGVLVLTAAFVSRVTSARARVVALVLVAMAPLGWAMHQHHASGRWSVGTSLDGMNLHKGNAAEFLQRYPPPGGDTLDRHDAELNRGRIFEDEWSFNDFHDRAALAYVRGHMRDTAVGDGRKLEVLLLSLRKVGSGESHGAMRLMEGLGMVGFRLLLWSAIGGAVYGVVRRIAGWWWEAGVFLLVVAACVLPYVAGFGYTRHGSVLIYPAALMCCRMLTDRTRGSAERQYRGGAQATLAQAIAAGVMEEARKKALH
jgi:hypothetical protein